MALLIFKGKATMPWWKTPRKACKCGFVLFIAIFPYGTLWRLRSYLSGVPKDFRWLLLHLFSLWKLFIFSWDFRTTFHRDCELQQRMTRLHKVYSNVEVPWRHIWCGTLLYISAGKNRLDILKYLLQPAESFICISFPIIVESNWDEQFKERFILLGFSPWFAWCHTSICVCMHVCMYMYTPIYMHTIYVHILHTIFEDFYQIHSHSLLQLIPDAPPCSLTKFLPPFFFFFYNLLSSLCTAYIFMDL